MKKAVVVGSGAGGAAAARVLQGPFDVTILEAGGEFRPFPRDLGRLEGLRKTGIFFDERLIRIVFPFMKVGITPDGVRVVRGAGTGGTTTLATGNGIRADGDLKRLGIDLDDEFAGLYADVPVSTAHEAGWTDTTKTLFRLCAESGFEPEPMPKMGAYERCTGCGRCIFGCPSGVKWDGRRFLSDAVDRGARLLAGHEVMRVCVEGKRAVGVLARSGAGYGTIPADLVVLAAGGLGTPVILNNSGFRCEERLFVDPVLCVAAELKGCAQNREVLMPFVVRREGYIVSPYFDYLSFFFNRQWRHRSGDVYSVMIKLADESAGAVRGRRIAKTLTEGDRAKLREAVEFCVGLFGRLGVRRERTFLGTLNAGHPGGMLPLTEKERESLHHPALPDNLYVADPSLLPKSPGSPPILTIMALARKVGEACARRFA